MAARGPAGGIQPSDWKFRWRQACSSLTRSRANLLACARSAAVLANHHCEWRSAGWNGGSPFHARHAEKRKHPVGLATRTATDRTQRAFAQGSPKKTGPGLVTTRIYLRRRDVLIAIYPAWTVRGLRAESPPEYDLRNAVCCSVRSIPAAHRRTRRQASQSIFQNAVRGRTSSEFAIAHRAPGSSLQARSVVAASGCARGPRIHWRS